MVQPYADKQIKLFSLTGNQPIAEKISKAAGIPLEKLPPGNSLTERFKSTSKRVFAA